MKFHIGNPNLENYFPEHFKGTPLSSDGRFRNMEMQFIPGFKDVIKWKRQGNPEKQKKINDKWRPKIFFGYDYFHEKNDCIVWLGHSSFYFHLNNKKILIDPVFGSATVVPRLIPFPTPTKEFRDIDYLLISHGHRDHCDSTSLKIISKQNPGMKVFTGLGMEKVLSNWIDKKNIQEAGWFQKFILNDNEIEIFYVPSRHWSKRWINDDNKTLWGGFIIRWKNKTLYFMGDSGYGIHFKQIASVFPNPDYCLMGIGAYKPEWFMGPSHLSPFNAVRAFNEMSGKNFIPMHYATFDLSDEPISDPINSIIELNNKGEISGNLLALRPGEIHLIT